MVGRQIETINLQFNEKANFWATRTGLPLVDWTVYIKPFAFEYLENCPLHEIPITIISNLGILFFLIVMILLVVCIYYSIF